MQQEAPAEPLHDNKGAVDSTPSLEQHLQGPADHMQQVAAQMQGGSAYLSELLQNTEHLLQAWRQFAEQMYLPLCKVYSYDIFSDDWPVFQFLAKLSQGVQPFSSRPKALHLRSSQVSPACRAVAVYLGPTRQHSIK